jgi:hypothetical protein
VFANNFPVRVRFWRILLLCEVFFAVAARGGSSFTADAISGVRPTWAVGDWWIVGSQIYDRGDKRAGAVPGWLAEETWEFSVLATNSVNGEVCYQVTIEPKDPNACPYRFCCWFRMSDLLVMRRELYQPAATRTGRPFSVPVVQVNYSQDEAGPLMTSDFPSLPLTTPHFVGGATNIYRARAYAARPGAAPESARSAAGLVTQVFHPGATIANGKVSGSTPLMAVQAAGKQGKCGVFVLAQSADRYERQHWSAGLPWHLYGEKREDGLFVRKSWLMDCGHRGEKPVKSSAGGGG